MNIASFFAHHRLAENPFSAEEARLDPVFSRITDDLPRHPDFGKVLGSLDQPSTAIVFGEKGSGKTAIRLLLEQEIEKHNQAKPDGRILLVPYDELNPILDRLLRRHKQNADRVLKQLHLADHQDAILSIAVSRLVSAIVGRSGTDDVPLELTEAQRKQIKSLPLDRRVDLAILAALYDHPGSSEFTSRFVSLRSKLGLGWRMPLAVIRHAATVFTLIAAGFGIAQYAMTDPPWWVMVVLGLTMALALLGWGYWIWRHVSVWTLTRKLHKAMPAIDRHVQSLRLALCDFSPSRLDAQPFPLPALEGEPESDARYQLTRRFIDIIQPLGYTGIVVLIDRVDEPTMIAGDADKMRSLTWPMFDNKFLKQNHVGLKLLLPVELRYLLDKETAQFFQEARLDKQNMVDRLSWSGATLYDLCVARLNACRIKVDGDDDGSSEDSGLTPLKLTDLFADDVSQELLVDALDQMHQPRDAFKFIYAVIQEHCRMVPEDQAVHRIPKLTLEAVRRSQAQRVQELYRGLTPA